MRCSTEEEASIATQRQHNHLTNLSDARMHGYIWRSRLCKKGPQKECKLARQGMELTLKGLLDARDGRQRVRHRVVQEQPHVVAALVVGSPEQPEGACTGSKMQLSHEAVLICRFWQQVLKQQHDIAAVAASLDSILYPCTILLIFPGFNSHFHAADCVTENESMQQVCDCLTP